MLGNSGRKNGLFKFFSRRQVGKKIFFFDFTRKYVGIKAKLTVVSFFLFNLSLILSFFFRKLS